MGSRAGEDHKCDPQSARFSDGWRSCASAGSRRCGLKFARGVLCEARRELPRASRSHHSRAGKGRLQMLSSAGRLLRDDGCFRVRVCRRCPVRKLSGERGRRCRSTWIELLSRSARWSAAGPVCILQKVGDVGFRCREVEKVGLPDLTRVAGCVRWPAKVLLRARDLTCFVITPQAMCRRSCRKDRSSRCRAWLIPQMWGYIYTNGPCSVRNFVEYTATKLQIFSWERV